MSLFFPLCSRIISTQSFTQNVGVHSLTTSKNYTWDIDGQLLSVDAQESWQFKYDQDGNMLSLTYRYVYDTCSCSENYEHFDNLEFFKSQG